MPAESGGTAPPVGTWTDWLRFRCTGCGNCCRETIVMLTDADVRRLALGAGLAPRRFVRFFTERELHMPRRHPFWIAFPGRRAAMGLRWAARGGSTRDRCIFLDREDRCTVYSDRPLACREHPFSLGFSTSGAVEDITLSDVAECLYELDGHLTRRQLARVSRWNERESEAYQARISVWNRQRGTPRTRGAFMKFLDLDWDRAPAKAGRRDPGRGQSADVEPFG